MSRRRSAGGWWAASVLGGWAAVACSPGLARADGAMAAPTWLAWRAGDAAARCPSARRFVDKVEQRLGASAGEAARRQGVTIAVEVARMPAGLRGWRAELRVNRVADGSSVGSRSIEQEDASCESVEDAVSFFATLVLSGAPAPLDGAGGPSHVAPASPSVSPPAGPPTVVTSSPAPPLSPSTAPAPATDSIAASAAPAAAAPPRWTGAVDAGPIVGVGLLPGLSYGAQASVSFGRPEGLLARLGLALWPDRRSWADASAGADISLVTASLGLCPVSARWPGRVLRGCADAEVGRLSATGLGPDALTEQSHAIFDLSAGARLEQVIVGRLFAALEARAEMPLLRVRVVYAGPAGEVQEVFRMQPVAAVGQVQLGWLFSP